MNGQTNHRVLDWGKVCQGWGFLRLVLLIALLLALVPTPAHADPDEHLDQQQTAHEDKWHDIRGEKWRAQSFVAGLTGNLTKVALYLRIEGTPQPLIIELRNCEIQYHDPGKVKEGGALVYDGSDYIYAFRGKDQKSFWRYSISGNSWAPMADAPDKVQWGGALAYDGSNYIYAFQGKDQKSFWRYSISGDSWTSMPDAPDKVKEGGALVYDGSNYIYAFRGHDSKKFWRYSISGNSWTSLADAPDKVKEGGALAYGGGDYIYAFRGHDKKDFWRYSISGNSWTSLADAPDQVKEGGALVYDGSDDGSDYIYAFQGKDQKSFWRYSISGDSWTSMTDAPDEVKEGGALAYGGSNYIYALQGHDKKDFWRYSISGNSWESLADVPGEGEYYAPRSTTLTIVESSAVTSTTGAEYEFTFSTPATVIGGTCYTIVLHQEGGDGHNKYRWSESTSYEYGYGAGNNSKSDDGDATWKRGGVGHDQYFKTYVDDQLDQQQTAREDKWHDIHGEKWWAQSFVAGLTGNRNLTKVALWLKREGEEPQPLVIELRNCVTQTHQAEEYYVPGGTIHASVESSAMTSTTGAEYEFTFATPPAVISGTRYTIVLHQKENGGDKDNKYGWSESTYDPYTAGNNSKSDDGGATWKRAGGHGTHDQYFKTYVTVSAYNITLTANAEQITADGSSTSTLTATVKDQYGNNVPNGTLVTFSTDHGSFASASITMPTTAGQAQATLTSESSTTLVVATIHAQANGQTAVTAVLFIAPGGAEVEDFKTEETDPGTDTVDAKDEADIHVTKEGSGTPTVTCAEYTSNPQTGFTNDVGKYYDLYIDSDTDVDSLTIKFYFTAAEIEDKVASTLRAKYWDGDSWEDCSNQTLHLGAVNGYAGYIEVTLTPTSSPNLDQLTGEEFGIKGDPIPQVGGIIVPVNKLELLALRLCSGQAPWIGLASLMAIALAAVVVRRRTV